MAGPARGGQGNQLRMAVESALGTPGAYSCTRPEKIPTFKFSHLLVPNHVSGHQNPLTLEKPIAIIRCQENAFTADFRIRRSTVNGGTPDLVKILKSSGWNAAVSTGATTVTGSPTVSSITQTSNVTGAGQFVLVEREDGVHVPVFVSSLAGAVITPHVRMSAASTSGHAINPMHTLAPITSQAYKVPDDVTLSFILNTQGFNGAYGSFAQHIEACALASVGDIVITGSNPFPIFPCTFHGVPISLTADAIAADSFNDSAKFGVVTPDLEFSLQAASDSGNIVLVSKAVIDVTINLAITVKPLYNEGGGNIGGITGYMLIQGNPTMKVHCQFNGDTAFEMGILTGASGANTSMCAQLIQPTRDLDHPAWGFMMQNAHIMPGGEPTVNPGSEIIDCTFTLTGSSGGINSHDEIDEIGTSPIYFGISGEAA